VWLELEKACSCSYDTEQQLLASSQHCPPVFPKAKPSRSQIRSTQEHNVHDRQSQQSLVLATVAARRLGISRQALERLIKRKEIKAIKVGNMMRVYIPQSEIDRIVCGRDCEPAGEATKHAVGLENSSDRPKPAQDAPRTPKERLNALVGSYGEWLKEVSE